MVLANQQGAGARRERSVREAALLSAARQILLANSGWSKAIEGTERTAGFSPRSEEGIPLRFARKKS
jgi:hypothetical protein